MSLLKVENLCVEINSKDNCLKKDIIKNISFNVSENETVVLIGQSGCGKSVTSMAVMNLLPPGLIKTAGDITILGKAFEHSMRGDKIGMIMQNPASCFDPVFTVKYHFLETLKSHNKPKEAHSEEYINKVIYEVGLSGGSELLDAYPFQLSGGMLQRLMIALTLALDTPLIIADEPTTDLDLAGQLEILELLLKIKSKRKLSLLLITHDLGVAAKMADRVIVMYNGEIVEKCLPLDLCKSTNIYTAGLIKAYNSMYYSAWNDKQVGK